MTITLKVRSAPPKSWALNERLVSAFLDKRYVDFELVCQDKTIPVHKAIVCTQSFVIAAAESWQGLNRGRGRCNFLDDELPLVERLVEAFYTGQYREDVEDGEFPDEFISKIQLHVRMYLLADKYQCDGVAEHAFNRFLVAIGKTCQFADFFAAIPELFEDHPALKELQEAAVETARKIMSVHSNRHERYRLYREAIEQTPNFGRSLLDVFVKAPPKWKEDEGSPSKKARYM